MGVVRSYLYVFSYAPLGVNSLYTLFCNPESHIHVVVLVALPRPPPRSAVLEILVFCID